jgi:hypothetical protein
MIRGLIGVSAAIALICLLAHFAAGVVVAGVAGGYLISLVVQPIRRCRSCHGHKTHGGLNLRRCWTCGGKGQYPRWGTYLLRRDVVKALGEGKHGRNW